jgi:hypothetical protein
MSKSERVIQACKMRAHGPPCMVAMRGGLSNHNNTTRPLILPGPAILPIPGSKMVTECVKCGHAPGE